MPGIQALDVVVGGVFDWTYHFGLTQTVVEKGLCLDVVVCGVFYWTFQNSDCG